MSTTKTAVTAEPLRGEHHLFRHRGQEGGRGGDPAHAQLCGGNRVLCQPDSSGKRLHGLRRRQRLPQPLLQQGARDRLRVRLRGWSTCSPPSGARTFPAARAGGRASDSGRLRAVCGLCGRASAGEICGLRRGDDDGSLRFARRPGRDGAAPDYRARRARLARSAGRQRRRGLHPANVEAPGAYALRPRAAT